VRIERLVPCRRNSIRTTAYRLFAFPTLFGDLLLAAPNLPGCGFGAHGDERQSFPVSRRPPQPTPWMGDIARNPKYIARRLFSLRRDLRTRIRNCVAEMPVVIDCFPRPPSDGERRRSTRGGSHDHNSCRIQHSGVESGLTNSSTACASRPTEIGSVSYGVDMVDRF
jgi:hypothetical protein